MDQEIAARIKYIRDRGFPKVADAIKLQIGSEELIKYLTSLVINPEEKHSREGFPDDVMDCILKIYNHYQNYLEESDSIWYRA